MLSDKITERRILLRRFLREDTEVYRIGKELGLRSVDKYDEKYRRHQRFGTHFYFPSKDKEEILEEMVSVVSDEKLVEIFSRLKPEDWYGVGFRGNFYVYNERGELSIGSALEDVKKDVFEALRHTGERGYAFLKAIVELHEEGRWSGDWRGASYSDILARIRRICGRLVLPAPRDFPILKSYRIYYKSGSRKYPSHSIPEEIIPAVKEALEEWRKTYH